MIASGNLIEKEATREAKEKAAGVERSINLAALKRLKAKRRAKKG